MTVSYAFVLFDYLAPQSWRPSRLWLVSSWQPHRGGDERREVFLDSSVSRWQRLAPADDIGRAFLASAADLSAADMMAWMPRWLNAHVVGSRTTWPAALPRQARLARSSATGASALRKTGR
jgi:hypothetical protein